VATDITYSVEFYKYVRESKKVFKGGRDKLSVIASYGLAATSTALISAVILAVNSFMKSEAPREITRALYYLMVTGSLIIYILMKRKLLLIGDRENQIYTLEVPLAVSANSDKDRRYSVSTTNSKT
jgi:hypothetical protein